MVYKPNDEKNSSKQISCKNYESYCACYARLKNYDAKIYKQKKISKTNKGCALYSFIFKKKILYYKPYITTTKTK